MRDSSFVLNALERLELSNRIFMMLYDLYVSYYDVIEGRLASFKKVRYSIDSQTKGCSIDQISISL